MAVLSRLRQRLSSALAPSVRRAGAGLWLDVKDLPARLQDPARWGDPWQARHNVGGGDFRANGRALMRTLIDHAALAPDQGVLDIGCGAGRLALPLADYLDRTGAYTGFDVSRSAVRGCRRRLAARRPDFRFIHADIRNGDYNAGGAVEGDDYVFPCSDETVDLVFAFSVFTHMRLSEIAHYLAESARVLRTGGRLAVTVYLVDADRRGALARGEAGMAFRPWRDGMWVTDPAHPERAMGLEESQLAHALDIAGLAMAGPILRGAWSGAPTYEGWQDLIVATKA